MVRRLAAVGLRQDDAEADVAISDDNWPMVLAKLYDQRLTGLAVAAAEGGSLSLSSEQTEDLLSSHRDAMLQALALERHLVTLSAALEEAAVDMVLLKGPALAHTVYPDPSWRPFADLDLMVKRRDWRQACEVLTSRGLRRGLPEPRAGFDERFGKAAEFIGGDGLMVDLHRTLVVGPFGLWVDPDELFEKKVPLRVGGRRIFRFDDTNLLIHACMHASLGWWPPLLMPVRDVVQVASFANVDWEVLEDRSQRWKLIAVVRHAFETAVETLGVALPGDTRVLTAVQPRRLERRALQAYITERRGRGGTALSLLRAIPGVRAKTAYVRALLFPSREFLRARQSSGESYLRRLAVPIRWLVRRSRGAS